MAREGTARDRNARERMAWTSKDRKAREGITRTAEDR